MGAGTTTAVTSDRVWGNAVLNDINVDQCVCIRFSSQGLLAAGIHNPHPLALHAYVNGGITQAPNHTYSCWGTNGSWYGNTQGPMFTAPLIGVGVAQPLRLLPSVFDVWRSQIQTDNRFGAVAFSEGFIWIVRTKYMLRFVIAPRFHNQRELTIVHSVACPPETQNIAPIIVLH